MTEHTPTYKLQKKPSVEEEIQMMEVQPFSLFHEGPKHHLLYSERKINPHQNRHRFGQHNDKNRFGTGFKHHAEDALSVLDQHERLEYSSEDNISEIEKTLEGLGIRRGHSFQQENINFSLSSDILNTEHENMMLKKKMVEMKKQLRYLREHDQQLLSETLLTKQKTEEREKLTTNLTKELQLQKQKVVQLQKELEGYQLRIEELQKLLANNQKRKPQLKISGIIEDLQNYKKLAQQYEQETYKIKQHYEEEIQKLKKHYESEIFQISLEFRGQIDETTREFENAKAVGQNQIKELISVLMEKDQQISKLKHIMSQYEQKNKLSTLFSDNPSLCRQSPKEHLPDPTRNSYTNRFFKFSQFVDQRISNSCERNRNEPQIRISRSAIEKEQFKQNLNEFREQMPQLGFQGINFGLSGLLEKNQQIRRKENQFWSFI